MAKPITQILASILLLSFCRISTGKPNTVVKSMLCNSSTYTKGYHFTISLAYILGQLESATLLRLGYDLDNISPYRTPFAYDHAACNQTLTSSDCVAYLAAAKTAMLVSCDGRIGAHGELYDCLVRYEQYPFDD
ncbi:antifungal protein ginkbilobin-like protein [Salvia miltiorrhiza]|uniref:antifungal protein ginkbilobin-like protein n=1 Tax=Salvia miltiorrhiza TaxID=226208 RepID=UPI0025ABB9C3|nr:antifungal protein ginkbilobin-like protein [Salvia miltiorrhiza]